MAIHHNSVVVLFALLFISQVSLHLQASHHVLHAQLSALSSSKGQPYRTGYHFQPPKNWINEFSGPMIYKGIYHLFYQYNPKGAVWGNIVWAHSTSTDLVNWKPQGYGIYPSEPSDMNGTWSGSTTFLHDGTPAILYTGINPKNQQVQNLAVPKNASDPYLRQWVKSPQNPLMAPTPQNRINASSFRDPTTAWLGPDKKWRTIIGSKVGRKGLAILYTSKDFVNWVRANHPLHSTEGTGMWECPDFFPVLTGGYRIGVHTSKLGPNVKHVLKVKYAFKVSLDDLKHDYYTIGTYNFQTDVYTPDKGSIEDGLSGLRYDYGKIYASKSFYDGEKKRRIMWGWVNESSCVDDDVKKGWAGVMAMPRRLWLDESGKRLDLMPIGEIKKLRTNPVELPSQVLRKGSVVPIHNVTASQADVHITFERIDWSKAEAIDGSWLKKPQVLCTQKGTSVKGSIGPFGFFVLASKELEEYTSVFFRVFKNAQNHSPMLLMCSDQSRSSLDDGKKDKSNYGTFLDVNPANEKLGLRTLIDHSIVESFGGNGKGCIAARVYPKLAVNEDAHLYVFNYGTQSVKISRLRAWSMKKAKIIAP
ncbi:Beta-fructofuranosidase, insoluble isoenzyme CWINV1 [Linum perenne]